MPTVLVSDIMSKSIACAAPDTQVAEVVELMRQRSYSCLVVAEGKQPIGIITERDILKLANLLLSGVDATKLKASAIMTHPTITIRGGASLAEAMSLCKEKKIRHLPVVDTNGTLCGILTQSDLINGFLQALKQRRLSSTDSRKATLAEDIGDGIPDVDLDNVERDLKNIFQTLHTAKNPAGSERLQSRFI